MINILFTGIAMNNHLKIYCRGVFWRAVNTNTDIPYYQIALYTPQSCLEYDNDPSEYVGYDIEKFGIQRRTVERHQDENNLIHPEQTEYFVNIEQDNICIWDHKSLVKIHLPKIYKPDHDTDKKERWEILDL
jgi:hypothetical protein